VLWEIFEFSVDVVFGAAMQQWNLPDDARLMGKAFQGSGLRDTMSDLILASGGALFAAIFSYLAYKNDRQTVLSVMRQMFPMIRRKKRTARTK